MKQTLEDFKKRYFTNGMLNTIYFNFIVQMILNPIAEIVFEYYLGANQWQLIIINAYFYLVFILLYMVFIKDFKDNINDFKDNMNSLKNIIIKIISLFLKKIGIKIIKISDYLDKSINEK